MAHTTANAIASWSAAEARCFQYFLDALQAISGVTGYTMDDFPRQLSGGQTNMWTFEINGDSPIAPTVQIQKAGRPYGCWRFGAQLMGVFETRKLAQDTAGMALNALPADSTDITSVGNLSWASMPTVEWTTINKGPTGTDEPGWAMTLPLWIAFGNSDYEG